jgi:hypothetical protein
MGVCLHNPLKILCFLKQESSSRENPTTQGQERQRHSSGKPAIFGVYYLFVVVKLKGNKARSHDSEIYSNQNFCGKENPHCFLLSQFVKVAENYTAAIAPKEKNIFFPMANNG